jgi:O-acetyl-ADP-ribose deacetylase (regulator of RNase III)
LNALIVMIEIAQGNVLEADAEALVNTVNCVGVMGKGIALQFRRAFPDNYREYVESTIQNTSSTFLPSATGVANPGWKT